MIAQTNPQDPGIHEQAHLASSKRQESAQIASFSEESMAPPMKLEPSEILKKLYRHVAKRMHPDLPLDDTDRERRNQIMVLVNAAFKSGDEQTMRSILEEWESNQDLYTRSYYRVAPQ